MRLAIVGSRKIKNIDLCEFLRDMNEQPDVIISGGANGVDTLAAEYAVRNDIELIVIRPDYDKYGRAATHIRNRQIVEQSDAVLAIWDGESRGTLSTINSAKRLRKEVKVVKIDLPC